jgi:hypothetical protein
VHLGVAGGGNGAAGENDTLDTTLNAVYGSAAADVLTGGAAAERITGLGGS